jgi:hypothetical protein
MDNTQGINNEEVQEEIFSPFNENVIERDYTRPNVQGQIDINPIDEPILIAPTFEDLQSAFQSNLDGDNSPSVEGDSDSSGGGWSGGANESMNELDNKEKKQASSAMVDAVLDGYQQVWKFANEQIKISPKKVNKLVKDGEINPNVGVPVQGGQLPFLQFVDVYNKELDGVLEVDDEFKEKVKPVMQRVFMKRNIGMTDEQLLMYYFGIDIISKGATMYTIIGQNKELLNSIKEMSIGAPTPPPTGARTYEEPKTAQTERTYEEPAPTREYKEPEEKKAKPTSEYEEVEVIAEEPKPKTRTTKKADTGLPKFGDADLLAHMESIANKDTPTKGTRGRRKKI